MCRVLEDVEDGHGGRREAVDKYRLQLPLDEVEKQERKRQLR